jgi:hypothetical protein
LFFLGIYVMLLRSKLRELFPVASFSGGISLSDQGLDLLNKLLNIDPKQVKICCAVAAVHRTPHLTVLLVDVTCRGFRLPTR